MSPDPYVSINRDSGVWRSRKGRNGKSAGRKGLTVARVWSKSQRARVRILSRTVKWLVISTPIVDPCCARSLVISSWDYLWGKKSVRYSVCFGNFMLVRNLNSRSERKKNLWPRWRKEAQASRRWRQGNQIHQSQSQLRWNIQDSGSESLLGEA